MTFLTFALPVLCSHPIGVGREQVREQLCKASLAAGVNSLHSVHSGPRARMVTEMWFSSNLHLFSGLCYGSQFIDSLCLQGTVRTPLLLPHHYMCLFSSSPCEWGDKLAV